VLCPAARDAAGLADHLFRSRSPSEPAIVGLAPADEHPSSPLGSRLAPFDVRAELGRKGTSTYDRWTALAVVAGKEALDDAGITGDETARARTGVVVGTTAGGVKSTMDYSRETLVQERPYLVNPAQFPNTVMNGAAGQAAIRFGLKGVNATIAGGQLAFLSALRYARNALACGYAETLLVGAAEELTPHTAWTTTLLGGAGLVPSEGAAFFVLDQADAGAGRGDAVIESVVTRFCSNAAGITEGLAGCVRRALAAAAVDPGDVGLVVTGDGDPDGAEAAAADAAGAAGDRLRPKELLGETNAAAGALALASVLGWHAADARRDGRVAVITGSTPDGNVGAAVVRGWQPCRR
jgi:3-oxoacyl-[acyl-carrier-protein] synthase II